ncbi:growth hormone-regulated TBC protein 1-like [Chrysoperla carnea]|uniref:growth hormone-regulated TBC protein 1-like n=1 Tax=Chrysoperla carnea TaxID=189513 RepID=UPI001D07CB27|nr:growth hormone-regulated TBC protein 1-like [Chrysoperla carnea]
MAQKSNFSKTDEYGFERPEDFDYATLEEFMSIYLPILARRAKKWSNFLKKNPSLRPNAALKRYIRKGVPSEHRGRVWLATSGADVMREKNQRLYQELLKQPYNKEVADTIRIDLPRTFPDNIYFHQTQDVQDQLFRILIAFSIHNKEIGYCQGMNYIAGLLLLVTKNEETSFWLFLVLIEHHLPPNYYSKSMHGLITDINTLERLVDAVDPRINQHFKSLDVTWPIVVTKWFVCLFVEVLPIETVLRIWDCLFAEGNKILFRVSLTLIRKNRDQLLACTDFPAIITCFRNMTRDKEVVNCQQFLKSMFKESLARKTIEELRKNVPNRVS